MMSRCPACGERRITARHKLSSMRKRPCPACGARITFSKLGTVLGQVVPWLFLALYLWLVPNPSFWAALASFLIVGTAASLLLFLYATPLYVAGSRAARIDMGVFIAFIVALMVCGIISEFFPL